MARCSCRATSGFSVNSFTTGESFNVFISAVIGGLGSLGGAFLGALYLRGTRWFINDPAWQLLSTGLGVLLVLLVLPGGLGSLWVKLRDTVVRLLTGHRVDEPTPRCRWPSRPGRVAPSTEAIDRVARVAD